MGERQETEQYDRTTLNTIRRAKPLAKYDKTTISSIIREAKVLHIAFVDEDGMPQCIPMTGALQDNKDGDLELYLHGHPSSRVYKRLSQPDVRVVATGTLIDGYVLALSNFGTGLNYRSAVLHGYTVPLGAREDEDPETEKVKVFADIMERTIPGRWEYARKPTAAEFKGSAVMRILIERGSAKIRNGQPVDKKEDMQNDQLTGQVWAGVIPIHKVMGEPQSAEYSRIPPPEHVFQLRL